MIRPLRSCRRVTGESLDHKCVTATVVRTRHRRVFAPATARNAWVLLGALHPVWCEKSAEVRSVLAEATK